MKIKQVCQITDLTDRAIRYYIEEELIFPDYTENYLGRRTFDFCEGDIKMLNNIAILRKFGSTSLTFGTLLLDEKTYSEVESHRNYSEQSVYYSTTETAEPVSSSYVN